MNINNIGSSFNEFLESEGIDLNKEPEKKSQMSKLDFFKTTLQKYIDLENKFNKIDKTIQELLDNDLTQDYPIYLSNGFNYEYQRELLNSLAYLWNEPINVLDMIEYLIYECSDMENGGYVKNTITDKKYTITNVDNLCIYLLDHYKIGE